MAEGVRLRRIADPVVAAPPAGARVRTRIHVTAAEAAALATIGDVSGVGVSRRAGRTDPIAAFWTTTAGRRGAASVSE